jgi:hypothetical protein
MGFSAEQRLDEFFFDGLAGLRTASRQSVMVARAFRATMTIKTVVLLIPSIIASTLTFEGN